MSLATKRFCHADGGEITTSPPMSSLQCMWLRNAADSSRSAIAALAKERYVFLKTATPAHSRWPGSVVIAFRSITTFSQSSSRPDHDRAHRAHGAMSCPPARARCRPRSTASATATHCGTVKQTVALMLMPVTVAFFDGSMPARVAGILTIMFGASAIEALRLLEDGAADRDTAADRSESTAGRCGRGVRSKAGSSSARRRPTSARPPPSRSRLRSPSACRRDERGDARPPLGQAGLQHGVRDHRIAGRADARRVRWRTQLVEIRGVVPQTRRRRLRHLVQRALPRRAGRMAHHAMLAPSYDAHLEVPRPRLQVLRVTSSSAERRNLLRSPASQVFAARRALSAGAP